MDPVFYTEGSCLTVVLPAEVDHPASDRIRRESDKIMEGTYIRTIVFDFAQTGFMDSSGIGLMMGRYRALGMRQGCIRAIHVDAYMNKLLHLAGLHRYVEIQRKTEEDREGSGRTYGNIE